MQASVQLYDQSSSRLALSQAKHTSSSVIRTHFTHMFNYPRGIRYGSGSLRGVTKFHVEPPPCR